MEDPGTIHPAPRPPHLGHWTLKAQPVAGTLQAITTRGQQLPSTKTQGWRVASIRSCREPEGEWKERPGAPHLFSVEQKNCTHGLVLPLSGAGGRYMASEKHVSSSFNSSILREGDYGRGFQYLKMAILLQKDMPTVPGPGARP